MRLREALKSANSIRLASNLLSTFGVGLRNTLITSIQQLSFDEICDMLKVA